jgi:hypothetical protein
VMSIRLVGPYRSLEVEPIAQARWAAACERKQRDESNLLFQHWIWQVRGENLQPGVDYRHKLPQRPPQTEINFI